MMEIAKEELKKFIGNLIETKAEGQYWDFKEMPHENKADLLHDILCMANAKHPGDRYLIFGVTDPGAATEVIGLNSIDHKSRWNQQMYIDFLRSKNFASNIRPQIALYTIDFDGKEIDVLVISNQPLKPYHLAKEYRDGKKIIQAGAVHTRTGDSNTPINETADLIHVEHMWKERFFLDTTPVQKMRHLLSRPSEWKKNMGNANYAYHKQHPEYNIQFSDLDKFSSKEAYCYYYLDPVSRLGTAKFYYHSTLLFEHEYMACDGFKIYLPVPKTQYLNKGDFEQWYHYYCLTELGGIFLQFLTDNTLSFSTGRGSEAPFLIFETREEHSSFIELAEMHLPEILEIKLGYSGDHAVKEKVQANDHSVIDPGFLDQIHQFRERLQMENMK